MTDPKTVKDYRPISLINTSIKILLKVLASRLACHLDCIVGDTQTGFMRGRQAAESIMTVKEVVHSLQKNRSKGMVLKLDFEKAFDSVNWEFLLQVLESMNFDHTLIVWIKSLLNTSRISLLVNGSPIKEFSPGRGLRQGDPLSPLLFNIVGEVLNTMLRVSSQKGILQGISLNKDAPPITHLQYADDTVIFLDNTVNSVKGVKRVLQSFQMISGLKINFDKSEIYTTSFLNPIVEEAVEIIKCKVGKWPMKYLGMSVGSSSRRKIFWEPLIRKIKHRLASWKADHLNQAGNLTLVKSVLDSLPI